MKPLTRGQRRHLLRLVQRNVLVRRLDALWLEKLAYSPEDGTWFEVRDWPAVVAASKYKQ